MLDSYKVTSAKNVIVGVGSALVDICLRESAAFVREAGAQIGGMTLVDQAVAPALLRKSGVTPAIIPGGSACNTILGIGKLGGAARFIGKRGNDDWGLLFEQGLRRHNVEPRLFTTATPTGNVLSIITPDAQRSMLTFLGASSETSPGDMTPLLFDNACLVHLEGYLLFNRELMSAVLKAAKASGARISLDLASYTVVESAKDYLNAIMDDYIDIVIANEDEARAFTGSTDESESLRMLSEHADIAVVKLGGRGSMIAHEQTVTHIGICSGGGPVIDTTGAGDLWAAGFLYGITNGHSIEQSGNLGSACGYEVCQVIGATIPEEGWQRIQASI